MRPSEQPPGPAARLLRGAGLVARVRPWPHTPTLAHLVTLDQQLPLPSAVLRGWLNDLAREGYTHVRTGALAPSHRSPYDALGFTVAQQLTLLHLDLRSPIARRSRNAGGAATVALRRHQAIELPLLARVDASAFPPGWGLDASGLLEAARATPSSRIRVATAGGQVVGHGDLGPERLGFVPATVGRPTVVPTLRCGNGIGRATPSHGRGTGAPGRWR